jgi:hypothetical protein
MSFMTLPISKAPPIAMTPVAKVPSITAAPVSMLPIAVPVAEVIKIVVEVAEEKNRREAHVKGGIETPTKWAVEYSVPRDVRIAAKIRIPIPTASVPITHLVDLRPIDVGFRQIRRSQAAPAV